MACGRLAMPLHNGPHSIFPLTPNDTFTYDYVHKTKTCQNIRNMTPDFDFVHDQLNILTEKNKSQMLFVNGGMDPWLPACV